VDKIAVTYVIISSCAFMPLSKLPISKATA